MCAIKIIAHLICLRLHLKEGEKAAIIVLSVVGGLIGLLAAVLCVRKRRKWAPAKGELDGAVMAEGGAQRRAETEAAAEDAAEEGMAMVPGTPSTVHHSALAGPAWLVRRLGRESLRQQDWADPPHPTQCREAGHREWQRLWGVTGSHQTWA